VHGIQTVQSPVLFFHNTPQSDPHREHYELVTSTATLTKNDWLNCQMFAWAVQAFHCLNLTRDIAVYLRHAHDMSYRDFYQSLLDFAESEDDTILGTAFMEARGFYRDVLCGQAPELLDRRFGNVLWPPEELAFLWCATEAERFYLELARWPLLNRTALGAELLAYQRRTLRAPVPAGPLYAKVDLHSYLTSVYRNEPTGGMNVGWFRLDTTPELWPDLETWAREVCWWGRKGGNFRAPLTVRSVPA
jgi:hypothetical protein